MGSEPQHCCPESRLLRAGRALCGAVTPHTAGCWWKQRQWHRNCTRKPRLSENPGSWCDSVLPVNSSLGCKRLQGGGRLRRLLEGGLRPYLNQTWSQPSSLLDSVWTSSLLLWQMCVKDGLFPRRVYPSVTRPPAFWGLSPAAPGFCLLSSLA